MKGKVKLSEGLFNNGITSLEEGLIKLDELIDGHQRALKFAILNISHFIELSFKYFISTIHPILIYKDIFCENMKKSNTITLTEAVNFFINARNVESPDSREENKEFKDSIKFLRNIRNDIEHASYDFSIYDAQITIGKILSILSDIYTDKCNIDIRKHISKNLVETYDRTLDEYKHKLTTSKVEATLQAEQYQAYKFGDPVNYSDEELLKTCTNCGEETLILNENQKSYNCTFCEHVTNAVKCYWCYQLIPEDESIEGPADEIYFCSQQCLQREMKIKGCD